MPKQKESTTKEIVEKKVIPTKIARQFKTLFERCTEEEKNEIFKIIGRRNTDHRTMDNVEKYRWLSKNSTKFEKLYMKGIYTRKNFKKSTSDARSANGLF